MPFPLLMGSKMLIRRSCVLPAVKYSSGEWGSGAGKGGGSGGSIREAGGTFGKMEATREEEYFRKIQRQQLKKLKEEHFEEIDYKRIEIERLQKMIKRHEEEISGLSKEEDDVNKK